MDKTDHKPDTVGPCARCGRPVKNVKLIGSLIVGRDCRRKMLKEGYSEGVHKCPLCHNVLPDEHKLTVKEGRFVLEPTVKRRSLDEFAEPRAKFVAPVEGPASFELLSVEVLTKDEKREGNSDDGQTTNGGDDEGGRRDSAEDVSRTGGADRETKGAEKVHRPEGAPADPSEDA